jgi:hypothetical protein
LRGASDGLMNISSGGTVRGKFIITVREALLDGGFTRVKANSGKGCRYMHHSGEDVRIMRRNSVWDIRVQNKHGNYLDEFGNVARSSNLAHGIQVFSR